MSDTSGTFVHPDCEACMPEALSYGSAIEQAERRMAQGQHQYWCVTCKRWRWPAEIDGPTTYMRSSAEPCAHPGCRSHVSHPCEGCGRQWTGVGVMSMQQLLEQGRALLDKATERGADFGSIEWKRWNVWLRENGYRILEHAEDQAKALHRLRHCGKCGDPIDADEGWCGCTDECSCNDGCAQCRPT